MNDASEAGVVFLSFAIALRIAHAARDTPWTLSRFSKSLSIVLARRVTQYPVLDRIERSSLAIFAVGKVSTVVPVFFLLLTTTIILLRNHCRVQIGECSPLLIHRDGGKETGRIAFPDQFMMQAIPLFGQSREHVIRVLLDSGNIVGLDRPGRLSGWNVLAK
ncbi:hypothetical protein NZK35_25515 [Stieleria sp. ICT_E10.1]|nr:hypothetical protein [Stieleria sedimenti]